MTLMPATNLKKTQQSIHAQTDMEHGFATT